MDHFSKYAPLSRLTEDFYRVLVLHFTKDCPEDYNPTSVMNFVTGVYELRYLEDVSLGVSLIIDCSNINLGHVLKIPPILLKKLNALLEVQVHRTFYYANLYTNFFITERLL